jgi:hypothetical protein
MKITGPIGGVLPGNVTIGGNLIVGGDELRIGAALPYTRLYKRSPGVGGISYNQAADLATRDSNGEGCMNLEMHQVNKMLRLFQRNVAGTSFDTHIPRIFGRNWTQTNVTGTVAETVVYSKTIPANTFGSDGAMFLHQHWSCVSQAAPSTLIKVKLGGIVIAQLATNVVQNVIIHMALGGAHSATAQIDSGFFWGATSGFTLINGGPTRDMTTDQLLEIAIQLGTVTDSWFRLATELYGYAGSDTVI